MCDQGNAMGLVERAATSLGDPGAAITNDGNIFHAITSTSAAIASLCCNL